MQYGFVGFSTTIPLGGSPQTQVPDGALGIAETAWDVFNAGLGIKAVIEDIQEGSYGWAVVDGIGAAYDIFATAVPVLPGGVSAGLKGIKAAGRVDDALDVSSRRPTRAQRDAVFERSRDAEGVPRCEYCNREITREPARPDTFEADHRDPYSRGGETRDENLAATCRTCNRQKGAKTAEEFLGVE
jgi:hypothetical protein